MGLVIRRGAWPRIFQACAVPCERATGLFSARASPHHRLPFPARAAGRGSLEEGKEGTGQRRNAFPADTPRLPASKINRASRSETARALACTELPAASRSAGGRPPCRTGGRGRGQRQEGRATRRPGSPPAAPRSRPPEELRDRRGGEERAAPGGGPAAPPRDRGERPSSAGTAPGARARIAGCHRRVEGRVQPTVLVELQVHLEDRPGPGTEEELDPEAGPSPPRSAPARLRSRPPRAASGGGGGG